MSSDEILKTVGDTLTTQINDMFAPDGKLSEVIQDALRVAISKTFDTKFNQKWGAGCS